MPTGVYNSASLIAYSIQSNILDAIRNGGEKEMKREAIEMPQTT